MFGTIEAAINYIQSKIADFYNRRFEMTELYQQARANLQDAYQQGKFVEEARKSFDEVLQVRYDYDQLADKLRPLANAFNVETGLGAFPVVVWTAIQLAGGIASVILIAELLYAYYQRLEVQAVKVQQIKKGLLPPEAFEEGGVLKTLGTTAGNFALLGLVAIGGWLLFKSLPR